MSWPSPVYFPHSARQLFSVVRSIGPLFSPGQCNRLPIYTKTVQIYKSRKCRNSYPREKRERFVDLSSVVFGRLLERERLLWTVAIPMDT